LWAPNRIFLPLGSHHDCAAIPKVMNTGEKRTKLASDTQWRINSRELLFLVIG
jgi:hypothetical protein